MSNINDHTPVPQPTTPRWMLWTGRVLSAIPGVMMGAGGTYALLNPAMMKEGMSQQGWPTEVAPWLAGIQIVCAILYLIPQTAVLGAILLTGYFGGAVASHVRAEESMMAIPAIVFGIITWLGLWFRDARVRTLAPLRKM